MIYGDPSSPARSHHRRRALTLIESAHRTGWITAADHDLRVSQVEAVTTVGELNALVRDLADGAIADPVEPVDLVLPVTNTGGPVAVPDPARPPAATPGGRYLWLAVAALVLIVGAALLVLIGTVGSDSGTSGSAGSVASAESSPTKAVVVRTKRFALTAPGIARFKRDFANRFGAGTPVTAVSFFKDFAIVTLPDSSFSSYQAWVYRDGAFSEGELSTDDRGTITFDLRDLDERALAATLRTAPRRVGVTRPTQRTVVVTVHTDGDPAILIGLTNKRGDYGDITTTLAGKVLEVRPFRG